MGLGKWIIKNGPGSPGSTAKVFAKQYNNIYNADRSAAWDDIFSSLYIQRVMAAPSMGGNLYSTVEMEDIVEFTEGDLPLFVFIMMFLETSNFRNNIRGTFSLSTEVLHEMIEENAPSAIKLNINKLREKCLAFASNF